MLSGFRSKKRHATQIAFVCALVLGCISALAIVSIILPIHNKYSLEDDDCSDDEQALGSCHVDGNEQWKDEEVSDRWSTAEWMNGYNQVTDGDVNSDEYQPWVDKLKTSLGASDTDPTLGQTIIPPLAPVAQFVTGTTVIVPTCEPLWGCKQNAACVDRYLAVIRLCLRLSISFISWAADGIGKARTVDAMRTATGTAEWAGEIH